MLCSLCIHTVSALLASLFTILRVSWKNTVEIGSPTFLMIPGKALGGCISHLYVHQMTCFRFFIDRFHTYNHRYDACGPTFNIKRFRMPVDVVSEEYGHINTEVCEQWHSSVDMLTRHVASMSQFNFMLTLQVPLIVHALLMFFCMI
jgi:hypothetical protein